MKWLYEALFITIMGLVGNKLYAQELDTTKVSNQAKELEEVIVKASHLTRVDDHILAIPTKEQRKHAVTGYDLLNNLMIPGTSIDRKNGNVITPTGTATLYIDGREVDFREVQSLRPKAIARVEYYDIPNGKYAKDACAINIITKTTNNGGYTQFDALQGVGYLNSDYNLVSKFATGTKSLNLWAGYSSKDPKSSITELEHFKFSEYQQNRQQSYQKTDNRESEEYVEASISNLGKRNIWMLRGGMSWKDNRDNVYNGITNYWQTDAPISNSNMLSIDSRNKVFRPSVYLYGRHDFSDTETLNYTFDGYYSLNDYKRLRNEYNASYLSLVKEDYYYAKANSSYSASFKHRNKLTFSLFEFLRVSDSEYSGTSVYNQKLHSSETILFADYSQRLENFF